MLNIDVEMRCTIAQLPLCHWMRGPASPLTPYNTTKHRDTECLPGVIPDPVSAVKDTSLSHYPLSISGPSLPSLETRQHVPVHATQTRPQHCFPHSYTPAANVKSGHTHHTTPTSVTWTTTHGGFTTESKQKEVHRRKKTAVSRLEQRLRVLNDPTNSVILPSPVASKLGMKAKITSAGKKMVQTFLRNSSSHDVQN